MKISVVTASYNSEATIGFTIEFFLEQAHPEKEMLVIDGASSDATIKIVELFGSDAIRVFSEKDKGVYDAMNKGFRLFQGDAIGFLNSDDTFHDSRVLADIAAAMRDCDIVYGDLNMVTDHRTKTLVRSWRGGAFKRYAFQLGWVPPHPTFYMRREVAQKVGEYDLKYVTTGDYDYMLRALALNDFRVRYLPQVIADFQVRRHQHQRLARDASWKSGVSAVAPRTSERSADRRGIFPALRPADFSASQIKPVKPAAAPPPRPARPSRIRAPHP